MFRPAFPHRRNFGVADWPVAGASGQFSLLLLPLQPVLQRIVGHVARSRPELFSRLGPLARKKFLIDPTDLPFVLLLTPDPQRPRLSAHSRHSLPGHEASISGRLFKLMELIDGTLDGDALFFTRDLKVAGDTEAVVALRNTLDDLEDGIVDTVTGAFGPLSLPLRRLARLIRNAQPAPPQQHPNHARRAH